MLADGVGAQRVDFIAVPTRDRDRAEKFYGEALGLMLHRRYAPYGDGREP